MKRIDYEHSIRNQLQMIELFAASPVTSDEERERLQSAAEDLRFVLSRAAAPGIDFAKDEALYGRPVSR